MRADYKMYLELYNKAATLNEFNGKNLNANCTVKIQSHLNKMFN